MIGIYKLTNTTSKKFYIGSSKDIKERVKQHRWMRNSNEQISSKLLYQEEGDIICEILEMCEKDKLVEREKYHYLIHKDSELCVNKNSPLGCDWERTKANKKISRIKRDKNNRKDINKKQREYRQKNLEKIRAYDRARWKLRN